MRQSQWLVYGLLCALLSVPAGAQKSKPVVYIARHGQTEWNRVGRWQGDPDLDPKGSEDRVALFLLLREQKLDRVFSSARLRTRRTAQPFAQVRGLPLVADARLNELDGGLLEGLCYRILTDEELPAAYDRCRAPGQPAPNARVRAFVRREHDKRHTDKLHYRPPGGESYADAQARVAAFVAEYRSVLQGQRVLVVGHGGSNRILLAEFMGWPLAKLVHNPQANDWVYRVEGLASGMPRLSLYRDGAWRACPGPPKKGRGLDCAR